MRNRAIILKAGIICVLAALFVMVWAMPPAGPAAAGDVKIKPGAIKAEENLYPTNEYGWLTYYMHEVFERYTQARKAFDQGDMAMADADLQVMEIFTNLSKDHMPDALQDGKPFDKEAYVKSIGQLNQFAADVRQNLKNKKWADVPAGKLDPMMQTCVGCHSAYNIPTDFRIDTKFKVLTHSMHEIYEIYRQAGPLLQAQEWDKAMYCFTVLKPYIESIPRNIPETNQDGDPIDKTLFNNAYKDLKQFNQDITKRLESKSWMTGKPLPPPRIVVENCYACHTKAAKIPSPW
ncbi:MAG TPA: hypothetical protein VM658_02365 [bacterium]|nr:hypothetical protein [bacterium]